MIFKRGKSLYWFQFTVHNVRVRKTTKQGDAEVAKGMEANYRSKLSNAVGICATPEESEKKLRAFLEAEREREKKEATPETVVTFRAQANEWVTSLPHRRRKPLKPATVAGWQHALDKWVLPILGDRPLCEVGNGALKDLVDKMAAAKLSAKTIVSYTQVVKLVVNSAVNSEGERLYPREWNHAFAGVPIVQKKDQDTPTVTETEVQEILAGAKRRYAVLFALLAGSGLRIGEALALKPSDFSADHLVIHVRRSIWGGEEQAPKTVNAIRDVDLPEPLARLLETYMAGIKESAYLFATASGRPISQRNVLRALHATKVVGLHAFRRFRAETLRRAPALEDLVKMWLGHALQTVTDGYAKGLREDLALRRKECDRVGLGFSLACLQGPQKNVLAIRSPRQRDTILATTAHGAA